MNQRDVRFVATMALSVVAAATAFVGSATNSLRAIVAAAVLLGLAAFGQDMMRSPGNAWAILKGVFRSPRKTTAVELKFSDGYDSVEDMIRGAEGDEAAERFRKYQEEGIKRIEQAISKYPPRYQRGFYEDRRAAEETCTAVDILPGGLRPELKKFMDESWERSKEAYRWLGRNGMD